MPWALKNIRKLIYFALGIAVIGTAISCVIDVPDAAHIWIGARQMYGLWALALLVAAMLPGPLSFVLPWIPFKPYLIMGRRAIGISSFVMAVAHILCFLGPMAYYGTWGYLYAPGNLWISGLVIGLVSFVVLAMLAITSRRKSIRDLGPQRWKRIHAWVYVLLPAVLIHATFVGTDFGLNKGPDVTSEVDAGCLIGMLALSLGWLILFMLRKKGVRWKLGAAPATASMP